MKGYSSIIVLALLSICANLERVAAQTPLTGVSAVTNANNEFSDKFYNEYAGITTGNIVMSPLSVSAVMAMLEAGAGTGSNTSKQIQAGMSFPNDNSILFSQYKTLIASYMSTTDYTVVLADRIYPQTGFTLNTTFVNTLQNDFYAAVQQLDYSNPTASANTINNWVANVTNDLITNLVSPASLSAETRLVLVNAIYFKAAWKMPFPSDTTSVTFSGCNQTSTVDMMNLTGKSFPYKNSTALKAQVVALPYEGERFYLIVILPYINCLTALEASLKTYNISNLYAQLTETGVNVALPKFKIESTIDLGPILNDLGMKAMFTTAADFSNIPASGTPQLYVSSIVQKAIIEVDQNGTTAAAATAAVVTTLAFQENMINFNATHSVVVIIWDRNANTVLFMGRKNQ